MVAAWSTAAPTRSTLDLTTVAVQAYFWKGYYEPAGQASEVLAGERVEAGPGWTLDLPALDPPPGDDITTHVTVDFAIVANGNVVPVQVQHLPAIASRRRSSRVPSGVTCASGPLKPAPTVLDVSSTFLIAAEAPLVRSSPAVAGALEQSRATDRPVSPRRAECLLGSSWPPSASLGVQ